MSDYEQHSGKLRLVPASDGETLEQICTRLILTHYEKEDLWVEGERIDQLKDLMDNTYIIIDQNVYEFLEKVEEDENDSFIRIKQDTNGNFDFSTRFYNGGTCLSEMLEEGMTDYLKKEPNDTN